MISQDDFDEACRNSREFDYDYGWLVEDYFRSLDLQLDAEQLTVILFLLNGRELVRGDLNAIENNIRMAVDKLLAGIMHYE